MLNYQRVIFMAWGGNQISGGANFEKPQHSVTFEMILRIQGIIPKDDNGFFLRKTKYDGSTEKSSFIWVRLKMDEHADDKPNSNFNRDADDMMVNHRIFESPSIYFLSIYLSISLYIYKYVYTYNAYIYIYIYIYIHWLNLGRSPIPIPGGD
jgi:hypothetical protein